MTPRSKIESLEADDTVGDLLPWSATPATPGSRSARGDLDETIGVVHLKQVFELPHADRVRTRAGPARPAGSGGALDA